MDLKEMIIATVKVLEAGGIIVYPTDTVWGIGCDATNSKAVEKIYKIKERAESKGLILLVDNSDMIYRFVKSVPEIAIQLVEVADKPLTIIYPNVIDLPDNIIAEDGSVAIRVPDHDFCKRVISKFNKPIVSTSANISGNKTPITLSEISSEILKAVDLVVDSKFEGTPTGKPSSIIKLSEGGEFKIIRG